MNTQQYHSTRYFTAACCCSLLFTLAGCGYKNPPGKWVEINASALYFSGVELSEDAITSGYDDTCVEAQQEIEKLLIDKLPTQIAPLNFYRSEKSAADNKTTVELKLIITQCDIDSDQSGGSFSYYLSLPVRVTLTSGEQSVLDYSMKTYEQVQIDVPNPIFEFSFTEPVARTLLLFKGNQIWLPNDLSPE